MHGLAQQRRYVRAARVPSRDGEELPTGVRRYEFGSARKVGQMLDQPCPNTGVPEAWDTWDRAVAERISELLNLPAMGAQPGQEGDGRGMDQPFFIEFTPMPRHVAVGAIFGSRWYTRLSRADQATVQAWLDEHGLAVTRTEGKRTVRDIRCMGDGGIMLAVVNDSTPEVRQPPAQVPLGAAPDAVIRILQSSDPSGAAER